MMIEVSKELADSDFVEALIERIQNQLLTDIQSRGSDLLAWNKYINEYIKSFSRIEDFIDVEDILTEGVENIIYKESTKDFTIKIKENHYIKNVLLDIESFCKLINYGNLMMQGTHIFTDVFNDTKKDLDKLIELYYSGEMI